MDFDGQLHAAAAPLQYIQDIYTLAAENTFTQATTTQAPWNLPALGYWLIKDE